MKRYEDLIEKLILEELNKIKKSVQKDTDIKKCKVCGEPKKRILDGTFDSLNRKWRDDKGQLWNGRVCGDCHKNKMKSHMKEKRMVNE